MKTSYLEQHIERLRQHYGSYSQAARSIGLDPRSFRRGRNNAMPKPAARLIIASGRLLLLRQVFCELLASGEVSGDAILRAFRTVRASRSK